MQKNAPMTEEKIIMNGIIEYVKNNWIGMVCAMAMGFAAGMTTAFILLPPPPTIKCLYQPTNNRICEARYSCPRGWIYEGRC